jgi:hypothetical protein
MTSPDPAQPLPLDYGEHPGVGVVTCRRIEGTLTLTSLRDHSRILIGLALVAAAVVLAACLVAMHHWPGSGGARSGSSTTVILMLFGAISLVPAALTELALGLHPTALQLDDERLTLTRRTLVRVLRVDFQRHWIIDVRVKRLGFQDTLLRPFTLFIVLTDGREAGLLRGSRAEVDYAASQLREALGLPGERWLEAVYPPVPRRAAVTRTISVDGATLEFRQRRVPLLPLAAAMPFILAGSAYVVTFITPNPQFPFEPDSWADWMVLLQVGVFALFGTVAVCGAWYHLARSTVLSVSEGRLTWSETGFPPGHREWPLSEVSGFEVAPIRFGGAELRMVRRDSTSIPLLRRRKRREVEWARENLQRAVFGRDTRDELGGQ